MDRRELFYLPRWALFLLLAIVFAWATAPAYWLLEHLLLEGKSVTSTSMPDHVIAAIGAIQAALAAVALLTLAYFSTRGRSYKDVRSKAHRFLVTELPFELKTMEHDRWIRKDVIVTSGKVKAERLPLRVQERVEQNYAFYSIQFEAGALVFYVRVNVDSFCLIVYLPVLRNDKESLKEAQQRVDSALSPQPVEAPTRRRRATDQDFSNDITDAMPGRDKVPRLTFPIEIFYGGADRHPAAEISWAGRLSQEFLFDSLQRVSLAQDIRMCIQHMANVVERAKLPLWSETIISDFGKEVTQAQSLTT